MEVLWRGMAKEAKLTISLSILVKRTFKKVLLTGRSLRCNCHDGK